MLKSKALRCCSKEQNIYTNQHGYSQERDVEQRPRPISGAWEQREREWGIGILVVFFNFYFFKEKDKTNVASCCYLLNLDCEYIFVIFCSFLMFEMFPNKTFQRIFYNTVLKKFPDSWGHEIGRQLLKLIKGQHREPEHGQDNCPGRI